MPNSHDARQTSNQINAEFLLTDIDVAMTFLDVAATAREPETVLRNHLHARKAYDAVRGFLPRVALTESERDHVAARLDELKTKLRAVGVDV